MAALTWRNVDAPDYRPSMEGFQNATNAWNSAFSGLDRAISRFDAAADERANRDYAVELARFADSEDLKASLAADPTLGGGRRVSAASINAGQSRVNDLLSRAMTEENFGMTKFNNDRTRDRIARREAADPIRMQAAALSAKGDFVGAQKLLNESPEVAALTYEDWLGTTKDMSGLDRDQHNRVRGDWQFSQDKINADRGTTRWNQEQTAYSEGRAGDALAQAARLNSFDEASAVEYINSNSPNPQAAARALSLLGLGNGMQVFDVGLGGLDGTTGGGAGLGGNPGSDRIMNYEARASGFASVPTSVDTLGKARDFAKQVNAANQRRMGTPGSSAMGLYQIVGTTMEGYAQKLYGSGWRDKEFSPQVQHEIATAIFNDNKGSADALRKQWVSLSKAEAEQVRKMPVNQALQVISQKESGGTFSPQEMAVSRAATQTGMTSGSQQANANTVIPQYLEAAQNNAPVQQVAASLAEQWGGKENSAYMGEQIRKVQARAAKAGRNITPALAAAMITNSAKSNMWTRNAPSWILGGEDGGGYRIDWDRVDNEIQSISNGGIERAIAGEANRAASAQQIEVVRAQATQAHQRLQRGIQASQQGRSVNIPALENAYRQAQMNLMMLERGARSDPGTTQFGRPTPPPTPVARTQTAPARSSTPNPGWSVRPQQRVPGQTLSPDWFRGQ